MKSNIDLTMSRDFADDFKIVDIDLALNYDYFDNMVITGDKKQRSCARDTIKFFYSETKHCVCCGKELSPLDSEEELCNKCNESLKSRYKPKFPWNMEK